MSEYAVRLPGLCSPSQCSLGRTLHLRGQFPAQGAAAMSRCYSASTQDRA